VQPDEINPSVFPVVLRVDRSDHSPFGVLVNLDHVVPAVFTVNGDEIHRQERREVGDGERVPDRGVDR
jgi:hypothetical protein